MRIVVLIRDGNDQLHLVATRAPDLMRRDLAARTGTAMLLWCAVPPEHHGADAVIAKAQRRLNACRPGALAAIPVERILAVLHSVCVSEPRRAAHWRPISQACRRIGRWIRPVARTVSGKGRHLGS